MKLFWLIPLTKPFVAMLKLTGYAMLFTNTVNCGVKHQLVENHVALEKVICTLKQLVALERLLGEGETLFNLEENDETFYIIKEYIKSFLYNF